MAAILERVHGDGDGDARAAPAAPAHSSESERPGEPAPGTDCRCMRGPGQCRPTQPSQALDPRHIPACGCCGLKPMPFGVICYAVIGNWIGGEVGHMGAKVLGGYTRRRKGGSSFKVSSKEREGEESPPEASGSRWMRNSSVITWWQ